MTKSTQLQAQNCPVCESADIHVFFEISDVPVFCNVLYESREEAVGAKVGQIRLGFCRSCQHVYNLAFSPELLDYAGDYENSLHFSPHFDSYAKKLAHRLLRDYELRGKTIVEIGCGNGDFLRMLCAGGENKGVGFDPASRVDNRCEDNVTLIAESYSEKHNGYDADFLCCRHVLEHIHGPREFLGLLRNLVAKPRAAAFFEVPNALFVLRDHSVWDILYEHYSYFTASSLTELFNRCGFKVLKVDTAYDDQYLCIEATLAGPLPRASDAVPMEEKLFDTVDAFQEEYRRRINRWETTLAEKRSAGLRGVVWGAGSKGIMFVNSLKNSDTIEHLVDINPRKRRKYVPCSGQGVVSPDFLCSYRPDYVVVMNRAYEREVQSTLSSLNLRSNLLTV